MVSTVFSHARRFLRRRVCAPLPALQHPSPRRNWPDAPPCPGAAATSAFCAVMLRRMLCLVFKVTKRKPPCELFLHHGLRAGFDFGLVQPNRLLRGQLLGIHLWPRWRQSLSPSPRPRAAHWRCAGRPCLHPAWPSAPVLCRFLVRFGAAFGLLRTSWPERTGLLVFLLTNQIFCVDHRVFSAQRNTAHVCCAGFDDLVCACRCCDAAASRWHPMRVSATALSVRCSKVCQLFFNQRDRFANLAWLGLARVGPAFVSDWVFSLVIFLVVVSSRRPFSVSHARAAVPAISFQAVQADIQPFAPSAACAAQSRRPKPSAPSSSFAGHPALIFQRLDLLVYRQRQIAWVLSLSLIDASSGLCRVPRTA